MSSKVIEVANKSMEPDDKIQRNYAGRLDGKYGYLVMTKKKLLFLREEGFISKIYTVVLELPYVKIGNVSERDRYTIEMTDIENKKNVFISDVQVSGVLSNLNEYRKTTKPVEAVKA